MSCSFGKLFKSHDTRKLSFFKGTLYPDVEASRHDMTVVGWSCREASTSGHNVPLKNDSLRVS